MKKEKKDLFVPICLEEMEKVRLMNRTDTKYWFHKRHLQELFEIVHDDYYILNMKGKIALPYATVYYDTEENKMFTAHHNGKLNRYKIRRRYYLLSDTSFLEVKFKNNKGRTIKKRIAAEFNIDQFNSEENQFLKDVSPFSSNVLTPSLANNFKRITLVNKNFRERCTIDYKIEFSAHDKSVSMDNLVIVEIKAEGSASASPLAKALRDMHIKTSGFSKYCIGRTVTDRKIKRNAFKQKIRSIEKISNTEFNLFN